MKRITLMVVMLACTPKEPAQVPPSATALNQEQAAAHAFVNAAKSADTTNDAAFVRSFSAALQKRLGATTRPAPDIPPSDEFYKNAAALLRTAAREAEVVTTGGRKAFGIEVLRGKPTPPNQHADCVAVGNDDGWFCTGTMIGSHTVLTAGHCMDGNDISRVFIGGDIRKPGRVVAVRESHRHPSYVAQGANNDIAVLLLDEDVTTVQPVRVVRSDTFAQAGYVREVGFGNNTIDKGYGTRRYVDVPLTTHNCQGTATVTYGCNPDQEFVATPVIASGVCTGDSGGPAYVKHNAVWYVAGITSRPAKGVTQACGGSAIFVRPDRYVQWLGSVAGAQVTQ